MSWWARIKSYWRSRTRTRSEKASHRDSCRSSSRAYHEASAIFDSSESFLEIVLRLWPIADVSIGDVITRDQSTHCAKCSPFSIYTDDLHCLLHVSGSTYYLSQSACHESQFHLHHFSSTMTHQCCFPDHLLDLIENAVFQFHPVVLTLYLPLHSSGMNVFKPGRMMGKSYSSDLVGFVDFI